MSTTSSALPSPSARQLEEIQVTVAVFDANPEVRLLDWHVIDPAVLTGPDPESDGLGRWRSEPGGSNQRVKPGPREAPLLRGACVGSCRDRSG
jgi:hypothetical protein